ncbi:MAG: hypothetical protein A4E62_01266 [Syntrophorhabdus sp. PtaU1.Bin002]|nr:MAG: hypothetical protein A4E58_03094 [Syntrophorhabdus sp. PtaB.Bin006]OPY71447.1 MAG: hypothetical protein A4E62_01266 [Syntrophorhabdus sp. PtaU1.Bin002]
MRHASRPSAPKESSSIWKVTLTAEKRRNNRVHLTGSGSAWKTRCYDHNEKLHEKLFTQFQ